MPVELSNTSTLQNSQAMLKEAQKQIGEQFARARAQVEDTVEEIVHDKAASPVSSEGHAGAGGGRGSKLNAVG